MNAPKAPQPTCTLSVQGVVVTTVALKQMIKATDVDGATSLLCAVLQAIDSADRSAGRATEKGDDSRAEKLADVSYRYSALVKYADSHGVRTHVPATIRAQDRMIGKVSALVDGANRAFGSAVSDTV